jgi:hypothetical protein
LIYLFCVAWITRPVPQTKAARNFASERVVARVCPPLAVDAVVGYIKQLLNTANVIEVPALQHKAKVEFCGQAAINQFTKKNTKKNLTPLL